MPKQAKDWEAEFVKIQKQAKKLAKRANQRMVRLERYQKQDLYSEILDFAYADAQKAIRNLYGKTGERLRFTENPRLVDVSDGTKQLSGQQLYKKNVQMLRQKVAAMEQFLEAKSSTKIGMDQVLDKRTNTINTDDRFQMQKYGVTLSKEELKRFFESKQQEKLSRGVGSTSMFVVAAVIKKNRLMSNKRDLMKFIKQNINLKRFKEAGHLTQEWYGLDAKNYDSYKQMIDELWQFVDLTGDKVLDEYIGDSLKKGINARNLFI